MIQFPPASIPERSLRWDSELMEFCDGLGVNENRKGFLVGMARKTNLRRQVYPHSHNSFNVKETNRTTRRDLTRFAEVHSPVVRSHRQPGKLIAIYRQFPFQWLQ